MKYLVSAFTIASALALGLATPAPAHQEVVGNLKIGHPWVRAVKAGDSGTYGCIIEIKNEGDEPETLIGATIDGAGAGVIYQIIENGGKFSSKPVDQGLLIKPHGSIELTPATYQIRFRNITRTLTEDSMVEGTLIFERQHSVPIHFMVEQDDTAPREEAASRLQGM